MPISPVELDLQTISPNSLAREAASFSFTDTLILLARNKEFLLTWTLSAAVLCTVLSYALQPEFTATTTLMPPQPSGSSSTALLAQLGMAGGTAASLGGSSLGLKNPLEVYVSLMKSETVEDAVIRRFKLQELFHEKYLSVARDTLEKRVQIDLGTKDGLIRLTVTDRDPNRAADIANGYIDEYRKFSAQIAMSEAGQRRLFFEQQLESQKERLTQAEEELKQTEQTTGLVQIDSQATALIQSATMLRAQVAAKEMQIASIRTYAASGNLDLRQAEQELGSLRADLAKLVGNDSGDGLMVSKGKLPQASLDYVRKLRDVKYNDTLFDILARQFESAKLDEAKEGAPIQVIDVAIVPDRRTFPRHSLFLKWGLLAGSLGSCLWVVLRAGLAEDPDARARWSALRQAIAWKRP